MKETGICGDNAYWTYDNDLVLVISGTGKMNNRMVYNDFLYAHKPLVHTIIVEEGITSIGKRHFMDMILSGKLFCPQP